MACFNGHAIASFPEYNAKIDLILGPTKLPLEEMDQRWNGRLAPTMDLRERKYWLDLWKAAWDGYKAPILAFPQVLGGVLGHGSQKQLVVGQLDIVEDFPTTLNEAPYEKLQGELSICSIREGDDADVISKSQSRGSAGGTQWSCDPVVSAIPLGFLTQKGKLAVSLVAKVVPDRHGRCLALLQHVSGRFVRAMTWLDVMVFVC